MKAFMQKQLAAHKLQFSLPAIPLEFQFEILKVDDQLLIKANINSINAINVAWISARISGTSQVIILHSTTI